MKDLRIVEDLRRFKLPPPQPQEFVTFIRFWLWNDSREKCLFFSTTWACYTFMSWAGGGGVASLIYAQYAHLYYYGLWMRSTRINLIESSMCHKNPETEMEEKEKDNEREVGRELDWNSSQAKWQLPRPRQVAGQAPSSRRGTNNNSNNSTLWKVGGNQLTRLIGWLRDWQTLPRLAAIWHCLYRLLIRCTICIYI